MTEAHGPDRTAAAAAAAAAFLFYLWMGVAPSLGWGDGAILARNVAHIDLAPSAHGHPLYVLAARVFSTIPWGDLPHRLAVFSAFSAAVTVGVVHLLVGRLTGSAYGAGVAATSLAVSHTFWLHASMAEVYAFFALVESVFLLGALEFLAGGEPAPRRLAALAAGAAVATHPLGAAFLPLFLVLAALRFDAARLRVGAPTFETAVLLGCFLVGASPLAALLLRAWISGGSIADLVAANLGGPHRGAWTLDPAGLAAAGVRFVALLLFQFPSPAAAFALGGAFAWRRSGRRFLAATAAVLAGTVVLAAPLSVKDQFVFFLPAYLPAALCVGAGAGRFAALPFPSSALRTFALSTTAVATWLLPILLYAVAPGVARGALADRLDPLRPAGPFARAPTIRALPGRDDPTHYLWPPKGEASARPVAERVLASVAPGAWVLADWAILAPCLYLQEVEGVRPDVTIVEADRARQASAAGRAAAEGRPVYVTTLERAVFDLDGLAAGFEIEGETFPWRLRPRTETAPAEGAP